MVLAVYDPTTARGDDADKAIEYVSQQKKACVFIHPDTLLVSQRITR